MHPTPDVSNATPPPPPANQFIDGNPSVELASNRTSLSFERTLLSADRTLMSSIRTAISLIGFGFTIYEAFRQLRKSEILNNLPEHAPRNFGLTLILLGVGLLVFGIAGHAKFRNELSLRRERLHTLRLLRREKVFRANSTYILAFLLLIVGIGAAARIIFSSGIFG
jgi:putative membrane protein